MSQWEKDHAAGWLDWCEVLNDNGTARLEFCWMKPCSTCAGTGRGEVVDIAEYDYPCDDCYGTAQEFVLGLNEPVLNLARNVAVAALLSSYIELRAQNEILCDKINVIKSCAQKYALNGDDYWLAQIWK